MVDIPDNELEYIYRLAMKKYNEFMPDVVANTVINMIRFHDKYDSNKGARTTWIYAIMRNIALKMLDKKIKDKKKPKIIVFSDFESNDEFKPEFGVTFDNLELVDFKQDTIYYRERIRQILYKLSERQQKFIGLVMAGHTVEEIKKILKTNRQAYFELEKRAQTRIKELLCV